MNQQGQGPGSSYPTGDLWDVKDQSYAGQQQSPDHAFSELVEVKYTQSSGKLVVVTLIAILLLGVGGYSGYEYFVNNRDPIEAITSYFNSPAPTGTAASNPVATSQTDAKSEDIVDDRAAADPNAVSGNPYWDLPNRIVGTKPAISRPWTSEEEEALRAGLTNTFTYQQYKAVMEVRSLRLSGSDAILWESLQNKKFWTRIWAAIGLAEFNNEIGLETLEEVLKNARSELIATFLERLQKKPNAGQVFIARQLVKVLDERGRLSALKVIYASNDKLRDLYLSAATADPGRRIQKWIRVALARRPINPDRYNELMEVVRGSVNGNYLILGEKAPAPIKQSEPMNTGSEEEDEDFTGDIEFFEEDMTGNGKAAPVQDNSGSMELPEVSETEADY